MAREKWIQSAKRKMKERGTTGAFTEYCGGRVTRSCIDKALNSNDKTLQQRARFAASMLNLRKEEGGFKLPGGVMKPIGYGAYKFEGNKHDEAGRGSDSGIILEQGGKGKQGLEVEDGELQVETQDGEYIVSDYLINPRSGNTLAEDLEKELETAGSKEEADAISKKYVELNEKLKGKKKTKRAEEGTPRTMGFPDAEYPYDALQGDYSGEALTAEEADIGNQRTTDEKLFGKATMEGYEKMKAANPWYDWKDFDPTSKEDVKKFQEEFNERAPEGEKLVVDGKYGTQTQSAVLAKEFYPKEAPKEPEPEDPSEWDIGNFEEPVDESEPAPEKPAPAEEAKPDTSKRLPLPGTFLQAAGDVAGLLKNYDVTPNLMAPAYRQGPRFGRVNMDPQRAALQQQTQGQKEAVMKGLAGPGSFAMMQSLGAQEDAGQRGIDAQEAGQNVQIASQEKSQQAAADKDNVASFMGAGQYNASVKNRADEIARENKMYKTSLAQNIGDTAAQQYADTQKVKADMFKAQASQVDGEFDRAYLNYGPKGNFLMPKARLYPEGNTTLSPEQISAMYNQQAQASTTPEPEATEEPEAKRGRYIKKSNKVRRKKRKRK
jgi:hypothetical protein